MATEPTAHFSPEEYLAFERRNEFKSEYLHGQIFAMTGASRRHNLIAGNLFADLHSQLKRNRRCEVFANDMRVRVPVDDLYTYPDVVVVCGQPQLEDRELDTLLNPVVLVEVLSESTEAYDRGVKFEQYRTLESLTDYLLIAQDRPHVEHYTRQPDGRWLLSEAQSLQDVLHIGAIGCDLALADVYEKVSLAEAAS